MKRTIILAGLFAATIAVVSGVALLYSSRAESRWKELNSVAELREQFNQGEGSIRIVLLLSPT